jgi:hypothetical protein
MVKPKRKKGRPKFEFTPEILALMEKMAERGFTREEIGYLIGCSQDTIERAYADKSSEVFAVLSRGDAVGKSKIRQRLYFKAMHSENPTYLIFYCKTRLRMSEPKAEVEISNPAGHPLQHEHKINEKDIEVLAALGRAYTKSTKDR